MIHNDQNQTAFNKNKITRPTTCYDCAMIANKLSTLM